MNPASGPYQAKDIIRILNITKSRYDYILLKIGISPDIEQGQGTGKMNLFSFRNVLQIAIASHAISIGINPASVRGIMQLIDRIDVAEGWGFFGVKKSPEISFFIGFLDEGKFFAFVDREKGLAYFFPSDKHLKPTCNLEGGKDMVNDNLKHALSYMVLNLSRIKEAVVSNL
jgi:hypothetical protein